jgi:hypothetical protein
VYPIGYSLFFWKKNVPPLQHPDQMNRGLGLGTWIKTAVVLFFPYHFHPMLV